MSAIYIPVLDHEIQYATDPILPDLPGMTFIYAQPQYHKMGRANKAIRKTILRSDWICEICGKTPLDHRYRLGTQYVCLQCNRDSQQKKPCNRCKRTDLQTPYADPNEKEKYLCNTCYRDLHRFDHICAIC